MIVLDSCGCGSAPDAARYGDVGANTLGNLSRQQGGLSLPHLESLGLGNLTALQGVPQVRSTRGSYGLMRERSAGKDTTTGHWEIAGVQVDTPFRPSRRAFPKRCWTASLQRSGGACSATSTASGTAILDELGPAQPQPPAA
jgi:phosphopentomutase